MKRLAVVLAAANLAGCGQTAVPPAYQGYIEADYVRVAAPFAGNLEKLAVRRGQTVEAGALLFVLDDTSEAAARREAEERLRAAAARLANAKYGRRPAELDVIEAQIAQAKAAAELAATQLKRDQKLAADGFISGERLDVSRTAHRSALARVAELGNQLRTARLPARSDEIAALEAEVEAARAQLAQSAWRLEQKTARAAKAGLVFDTLFAEGEWTPAGSPVVSLLPPGNVKLRFFVPEAEVGRLSLGQAIEATCDGCSEPIRATVAFVSPQPEFTPPVIYSNETRAKLVFLVEARPAAEMAARLHPGQPISVALR